VTLCTCDGWGWGASLTDSVGALRPAACCGACTSPRLLWCCTGMGMHCILAQPHELDPRTSSMQLWACAARLYRALGLGLCKGSCRPGWAGLCLSSSADLEQCHGCCYCLGCTCIGAPACAQPRSAPLLQTNLSARTAALLRRLGECLRSRAGVALPASLQALRQAVALFGYVKHGNLICCAALHGITVHAHALTLAWAKELEYDHVRCRLLDAAYLQALKSTVAD